MILSFVLPLSAAAETGLCRLRRFAFSRRKTIDKRRFWLYNATIRFKGAEKMARFFGTYFYSYYFSTK